MSKNKSNKAASIKDLLTLKLMKPIRSSRRFNSNTRIVSKDNSGYSIIRNNGGYFKESGDITQALVGTIAQLKQAKQGQVIRALENENVVDIHPDGTRVLIKRIDRIEITPFPQSRKFVLK